MERFFRGSAAAWLATVMMVAGGEGRLEISQSMLPLTITNSGSYVVTEALVLTNAAHGITIQSSDVTVDLNGFALRGTGVASNGIAVPSARSNIVVRNGIVGSWGQHGVDLFNVSAASVIDVESSGNGGAGIRVGRGGSVRDCRAQDNGGVGVEAGPGALVLHVTSRINSQHGVMAHGGNVIKDSSLRENTLDGVRGSNNVVVVDCTVRDNAGDGVDLDHAAIVRGCAAYSNQIGIVLGSGGLVADCAADNNRTRGASVGEGGTVRDSSFVFNVTDGLLVTNFCVVADNLANTNSVGIRAAGRGARVDGNHVAGNVTGIVVTLSSNFLARNTAAASSSNFNVAAGNHFQVVNNPGSSSPTSAWVNISF